MSSDNSQAQTTRVRALSISINSATTIANSNSHISSSNSSSSSSCTANTGNQQYSSRSASKLTSYFNSVPSLKFKMHYSPSQFDAPSRSFSAQVGRFLRSHLMIRDNAGATRQIRFGILLPGLLISSWLVFMVNSFVFRMIFGNRDSGASLPPGMPPTWIDRGDISDLDMRPTEGTNMTTAVLLSWERFDSLKEIVDHLCPYPMFKEIMIWNNKIDVHLEEKMFNCPKVRMFNSPNNMFFVARYMACAMASSPYCYFQDDDWKILYLRSMYSNFLRFPQFLHTDTNSDVWSLTNWRWCFFEDEVNLHACFSWLGTGALATRESVVNFLKQASVTEMDPLEFAYGDMYYSTFLNQVPYQLENHLVELVDPLKDEKIAFSAGVSGKVRNKLYMHKAVKKLWDGLSEKNPIFEKEELHPTYLERDVRSPCADDRCLILSNKHPFPDVRMFRYRPYIDITESEKIHQQYEDVSRYVQFPFSKAVDGLDNTAYKSTQPIVKGDYIGLDMLVSVERKVEYKLLFQMGDQWIKNARLEVAGIDAVYRTISLDVNCKAVKNHDYNGHVSADYLKEFLNDSQDSRVFDMREMKKYGKYPDEDEDEEDKLLLNYYEDYGWRTQCKFVIQRPSGFRFMRLVSGRDERYPFVIYDFGWKIV
ncbi:hypothetical protein BGW38_008340 [Lunasporangiospora selenospora]|uniref:Uncharacterized protein n=1 Tax=Lunasporangiospora selenospora TaxID=979761 RepID=A0A9P6FXX8_9FUNG|nr:hypothetical protein BGW38_008340 [Lunasporangiospora selenospora]